MVSVNIKVVTIPTPDFVSCRTMIKRNFSAIDIIGIIAAGCCMLHCLLTSVAIALLPYYGGQVWQSDLAHQAFACTAVLVCLSSIYHSYRKVRDRTVLACFITGLLFLITATFLLPERLHEQYEVYILSLGSSALVIGHIRNLRRLAQCC